MALPSQKRIRAIHDTSIRALDDQFGTPHWSIDWLSPYGQALFVVASTGQQPSLGLKPGLARSIYQRAWTSELFERPERFETAISNLQAIVGLDRSRAVGGVIRIVEPLPVAIMLISATATVGSIAHEAVHVIQWLAAVVYNGLYGECHFDEETTAYLTEHVVTLALAQRRAARHAIQQRGNA